MTNKPSINDQYAIVCALVDDINASAELLVRWRDEIGGVTFRAHWNPNAPKQIKLIKDTPIARYSGTYPFDDAIHYLTLRADELNDLVWDAIDGDDTPHDPFGAVA